MALNAPCSLRPALALVLACGALCSVLAFGPQRPIAEARRSAPPAAGAQPAPQASMQSASPAPSPEETSSPIPALSDLPGGRHKRARPSPSPVPSPTPTSPAFSTLDGYWEVVLQTPSDNFYSRFDLHQSADAITGVWTRDGKKLTVEGTYGGRQFKFVAKDEADRTYTLAGYIENASDMVGLEDDGSGKPPTAFTASHRAAYRSGNILPRRGEKREQ